MLSLSKTTNRILFPNEKRAHYYAESRDWKVKEIYHLEATSGKSVMEHPETQKMLEHIKTGHIL